MRVPLSWLREYAELPPVTGREVADRLIGAGLEVESVEPVAHEVKNVVVGEVIDIEELTGFKRPVRYCQVEVGEAKPHGVICGAANFSAGDRVPVALPGAVLPGGFEIGTRKAYGRVSEGMICSGRELEINDDHSGILVLSDRPEIASDVVELLGLRDEVLEIAVTPDRGYCLSVRGVAREAATLYGATFRDPADVEQPAADPERPEAYPAEIDDPTACDRFVLRTLGGHDPDSVSPPWLQRRLTLSGMRPVSLAVDVTNYVMIELGQPLHAFDRAKLSGTVVVRRAREGELLETLDHVVRTLDPEDILITDSSGPISMAGTIGGVRTEIDERSTDLVIEAAHFSAVGTARMRRRHRVSSEASHRFERGVDRELPLAAAARTVLLLSELGGGRIGGVTHADPGPMTPPASIIIRSDHPDRVAGVAYGRDRVVARLRSVGCAVVGQEALSVTPPSWRPDLTDPNDLAEEVIRLDGYDEVPSALPTTSPGPGLSRGQQIRRSVGRTLAESGYVEVLCYPFVSPGVWDRLELAHDDPRRNALRVANPLSEEEPLLRTTLLPGLLQTVARNLRRGAGSVALFEMGHVYVADEEPSAAPRVPVDRRPTEVEIRRLEDSLPRQPRHVAVALCGDREPSGWWGPGRAASWADAVEAARSVGRTAGVDLRIGRGERPPWHPGRCAEILFHDEVIGYAGELHPRVASALDVPQRTCVMEIDLDPIEKATVAPAPAPDVSTYPVATLDVALVVPARVPVAEVGEALRAGAGPLLESIRLFDVYTGAQIGEGRRSLAYALRFRAHDRTLTVEEATRARDAAIAEAARRTGAVLRGA